MTQYSNIRNIARYVPEKFINKKIKKCVCKKEQIYNAETISSIQLNFGSLFIITGYANTVGITNLQ